MLAPILADPHERGMARRFMSPTTPSSSTVADSFGWGALFGIASSLGYTATNICLRSVSSEHPTWVALIKSLPTILLALPWVLLVWRRGGGRMPTMQQLSLLIAAGVIGQLGGNIAMQWAFDVIGMAMTIPILTGSLIVSGALLAKLMLGETTSRQNLLANGVLVAAVAVLSLGAEDALQAVRATSSSWRLAWLGIGAACLPGVAYSIQNVVLRRVLSDGCHLASALLSIAITGAIVAAVWLGAEGELPELVRGTSAPTYRMMFAAGIFNAAAFVTLSLALRMTPIWFVYALSSSQVALAALLGVWLFDESATATLGIGVAMTIGGLMLIRTKK